MAVTAKMLNQRKEKTCFAVTAERKYYDTGTSFIKRSLRPSEWVVTHKGTIHVPRQGNERLMNEAATLQFIQQKTNIPVPKLYACFEDDNAVYLVTEYVQGVGMDSLNDTQRKIVVEELERHLETLHNLRSSKIGGPSGIVILPYRAMRKTNRDDWDLRPSDQDCVFCHNDLSQHNVIVDPLSLKINAIIDWEYAGFYPAAFERRIFERKFSTVAGDGEDDDSMRIVEFLEAHRA